MRYNRKSKNTGVPVWVWCLGVLGVYFMFLDKKVITIGGTNSNESTGRFVDEEIQSSNLFAQLKSKNIE